MSKYSEYINQERLKNNFIKMAEIDTGSCEETKTGIEPSTQKQVKFAKEILIPLLESINNLEDIKIDKTGIVTAYLQGNTETQYTLGLIAHMDTSEQAPTGPVQVKIHDYKTGNIELLSGTIIDETDLTPYKNHTIITSDGTTLLGADDKAGIAEIIEAITVLTEHPEIKCPNIKIAITPDEEIGEGVTYFDI